MQSIDQQRLLQTRRHFFRDCRVGLGAVALASLLNEDQVFGGEATVVNPLTHPARRTDPLAPLPTHIAPRAKNVIFLFMAGAPSQFDLFTPKPVMQKLHGQPVPASFLEGLSDSLIKGSARV